MVAQTAAGVCEIGFGKHETEQEFLYHLRTRGFRPVPNQNAITTVARQLSEYFKASGTDLRFRSMFPGCLRSLAPCSPPPLPCHSEAKHVPWDR